MKTVVVFTENNARIITVSDASKYSEWPNAVIDPDLSKVRKIPPHHWKLYRGQVLPMDMVSRAARDGELEGGAQNALVGGPVKPRIIRGLIRRFWVHALCFLAGAGTAFLVQYFTSK